MGKLTQERETKAIKRRILRDVKNLFEHKGRRKLL